MTALLGLIAVAGYQNRDKLAAMFGQKSGAPTASEGDGGGLSAVLGNMTGGLGSAGAGGFLSNGLRELIDRLQGHGKGEVANSWVSSGPNQAISPNELEAAIGPDVLSELVQRTGLSRDELIAKLARDLPSAVDKYTPEGRLPPQTSQ